MRHDSHLGTTSISTYIYLIAICVHLNPHSAASTCYDHLVHLKLMHMSTRKLNSLTPTDKAITFRPLVCKSFSAYFQHLILHQWSRVPHEIEDNIEKLGRASPKTATCLRRSCRRLALVYTRPHAKLHTQPESNTTSIP